MEAETIFGIILFIFCLAFFIWKIIEGRKKIDVFYKIDGFYFNDIEHAKEYWEIQKSMGLNNKFIRTYDNRSLVMIDKKRCDEFFKK